MSLPKLLAWTVADLVLALLIGTSLAITVFAFMFPYRPAQDLGLCYGLNSLGVPLTAPGLHEMYERAANEWRYTLEVDCRSAPADDQALIAWLRSQTALEFDDLERHRSRYSASATATIVRVNLVGPAGRDLLEVPWEKLGYKTATWPPFWAAHASFMQDGPPPAAFLLIYLGFLQVGFIVVGLLRCWRNRQAANDTPRGEWQTMPLAIGLAVVLAGVFWANLQGMRFLAGPVALQQTCLQYVPSIGWFLERGQNIGPMMTVHEPFLQLVAGVVIALAFPLAQELFFRGGLLGMWAAANRFWPGALLAALASAVLVLDWTLFPALFIINLTLAWLYRWSRSLQATLLAHILCNSAILCIVHGLIPSLPHEVDLLCGQWQEVETRSSPVKVDGPIKGDGQNPPPHRADNEKVIQVMQADYLTRHKTQEIEFLRGGTIRGGRVATKQVQLTPLRYEWVGPDEIELRWERSEIVGAMNVKLTLEFSRCKVAVTRADLTLTRVADGVVFRYRRDPSVYRGNTAPLKPAAEPAKGPRIAALK